MLTLFMGDQKGRPNMDILRRKTALVTGGGTGIGRGIALSLAKEGADVVVCGRRLQPLEETAKEAEREAGNQVRCLPLEADVSSVEDVDRLVKRTVDEFGKIDFLVNNAGIGGGSDIHNHSIESWDKIMAVNLRGPFLLSRAVLPLMRERRQGHIIQISSESGMEYYPGNGAYGVSKHALNALGEYIQRENQDFNIRLDTICPGMVISEMSQDSPGLDQDKCLYPDDIADLVIWLLTRRQNVKIGRPVLIQTMLNPWK
jgi:NAD(P)-dependent dehydrogenase (short-subunit alcohol dehydrogenase family)